MKNWVLSNWYTVLIIAMKRCRLRLLKSHSIYKPMKPNKISCGIRHGSIISFGGWSSNNSPASCFSKKTKNLANKYTNQAVVERWSVMITAQSALTSSLSPFYTLYCFPPNCSSLCVFGCTCLFCCLLIDTLSYLPSHACVFFVVIGFNKKDISGLVGEKDNATPVEVWQHPKCIPPISSLLIALTIILHELFIYGKLTGHFY